MGGAIAAPASSGDPATIALPVATTMLGIWHGGAGWTLSYKDEDASVLEVSAHDGAVQLDTRSRLPRPVFSHANSFAELTRPGAPQAVGLVLAGAEKRIEPAPVTAPARFAYVDAHRTFHVHAGGRAPARAVHRARRRRLSGRTRWCSRIYDGDKAAFSVTLEDWAGQASTQLSPTAGHGIPVNAIELSRGSELDTARHADFAEPGRHHHRPRHPHASDTRPASTATA